MARRYEGSGTSVIAGAGLGLLLALSGLQAGLAKMDSVAMTARDVVRVKDPDTPVLPRPDVFATPIGTAPLNSSYYVLSQIPGWRQVALTRGTGWIPVVHLVLAPTKRKSYFLGVHSRRVFYGALCGSLVGNAVGTLAEGAIYYLALADLFSDSYVAGSNGVSNTTINLSLWSGILGCALTPAAAAFGAWDAGEHEQPGGSLARSWGIATLTGFGFTVVGIGLDEVMELGTDYRFPPLFTLVGMVMGPTLGAAWAYEASQPRSGTTGFLSEHLRPPTVGLCMTGRDRHVRPRRSERPAAELAILENAEMNVLLLLVGILVAQESAKAGLIPMATVSPRVGPVIDAAEREPVPSAARFSRALFARNSSKMRTAV